MTDIEYAASVASRYPDCFTESGLAIPSRLATMESSIARTNWTRAAPAKPSSQTQAEVYARRLSWATILARISPVTRIDAAEALGVVDGGDRMNVLEQAGLAARIPGVKPIRWEITLPEAKV